MSITNNVKCLTNPRAVHTCGSQDPFDRGPVDRYAGEGAVQIDDVEPRGSGGNEGRRLGHIAAQQAHALAVFQVNGGI